MVHQKQGRVQSSLDETKHRLAQHYLNKLRSASGFVSRGRFSLSHGLSLFDRDWMQIQFWQAEAAKHRHVSDQWARLCKEFPFAGAEALAIRHTPDERLDWWESALDAAQRLNDRDAERAILSRLAMALSGLGEVEKAEQCARRLLELAYDAEDALHVGKAFYNLGTALEDLGRLAEAAHYYEQSLRLFEQLDADVDKGRALLGLGSIATMMGDYSKAYICFEEYHRLSELGGQHSDVCIALLALSEALRFLKRHGEAATYLQRSIDLCRTLNYQWGLGPSLIMMGVCAVEQGELQSAQRYLEEGIQIARQFGARRDIIYGLSSLGYVFYQFGNLAAALTPLQEALTLAREVGLPYFVCYTQRNLAYVHIECRDLTAAQDALLESLSVARELALLPETIKALNCAAAFWHALGESGQAAVWAGFLMDNPNIDQLDFQPLCRRLEKTLGVARFQQALDQGRILSLGDVLDGLTERIAALRMPAHRGNE